MSSPVVLQTSCVVRGCLVVVAVAGGRLVTGTLHPRRRSRRDHRPLESRLLTDSVAVNESCPSLFNRFSYHNYQLLSASRSFSRTDRTVCLLPLCLLGVPDPDRIRRTALELQKYNNSYKSIGIQESGLVRFVEATYFQLINSEIFETETLKITRW